MSVPEYSDETSFPLSLRYMYKISPRNQLIYIITLGAILITMSSLPFIYTQISIKSNGLLQSAIEKTELLSSSSGKVIQIRMKDNQKLLQGDTLMILDSSLSAKESDLLNRRLFLLRELLSDVRLLLKFENVSQYQELQPKLKTGLYQASYSHYLQECEEKQNIINQSQRIFNRYAELYNNHVLTLSEYEKYKFDYDHSISSFMLLAKRYRSQWQLEASNYHEELRQLSVRQAELKQQSGLYVLTSPVNGSLQNLSSIQAGTYIFANQKIGEISPDSSLMAFCYLNPADIGFIRIGQLVTFQIGAFNYNQWGMLSGKVLDISDDIILVNNGQAVFKVKCSLDSNYLRLKNNYKGYVKKGMNFTARFKVAERSLFQLLYDKVDNWVNPNLKGI